MSNADRDLAALRRQEKRDAAQALALTALESWPKTNPRTAVKVRVETKKTGLRKVMLFLNALEVPQKFPATPRLLAAVYDFAAAGGEVVFYGEP